MKNSISVEVGLWDRGEVFKVWGRIECRDLAHARELVKHPLGKKYEHEFFREVEEGDGVRIVVAGKAGEWYRVTREGSVPASHLEFEDACRLAADTIEAAVTDNREYWEEKKAEGSSVLLVSTSDLEKLRLAIIDDAQQGRAPYPGGIQEAMKIHGVKWE